MNASVPTVGVEEEYQLVDPISGDLLPNCKQVMRTLHKSTAEQTGQSDIQHELHLNQIEMASNVCHSLSEVRTAIEGTRQRLIDAAKQNQCELASAGTNALDLPADAALTPKARYRSMTNRFQQIARDLFIFGCHVHVAMEDRELGVRVMNRCRRWLPLLQALTANSPFWDSLDTGYASYRHELWAQWPLAGPPPEFEDYADYQACVEQLKKCGAIADESFIYWDIRLPTKVPTIEFRCADAMTRAEETIGYVGLVRSMVMHAVAEEHAGKPFHSIRPSLLAYAIWHAARYGMTDTLVDPITSETIPARELLAGTMADLSAVLDATAERQPVDAFVSLVLDHGTGAERQRRALHSGQALANVVKSVVSETAAVSAMT